MARPLGDKDGVADFELLDTKGERRRTSETRKRTPLLLAFYKASCPTCRLTLPFLQNLADQIPATTLAIWGIAQEMPDTAKSFAQQLGLTFPQLVDSDLVATEAYDLQSVPSLYLVDSGDRVITSVSGFSTDWLNSLSYRFQPEGGPLVPPEANLPGVKPG